MVAALPQFSSNNTRELKLLVHESYIGFTRFLKHPDFSRKLIYF